MNAERRVQRVRKAIQVVGESRPDWEIVCALAQAMGHQREFSFEGPEQIWNEIRSVWSAGAGISYVRLDSGGLQWPCPSEVHSGTSILHADEFPTGPRAALRRIPWVQTAEITSPDFPVARHGTHALPIQRGHHDHAHTQHLLETRRHA